MISALVDHKRHSEAFHFGLGLDRESDFVLQVVIPAQGLLLRSVSVHDEFVLDAVLSEGILFTFRHRRHSSFGARIRCTEVRPIFRWDFGLTETSTVELS